MFFLEGLAGVLAQMQQVQDISSRDGFKSAILRALQLENEDQLDMASATYEHALTSAAAAANTAAAERHSHHHQVLALHAGLFRCQLPDPSRLQALIARTDALLAKNPDWTRKLNEYRTEAVIRLGDWDKLDQVVIRVS